MGKMKKSFLKLGLMFVFTANITACAPPEREVMTKQTEEIQQGEEEQTQEFNLESYATAFPDYTFSGKIELFVGDRRFLAEEEPENTVEELVFLDYYYDIAGEYEKRSSIYGENEGLQIAAGNEKKRFDENAYMKEYSIHNLSTWSKEDFLESTYAEWDMFQESVLMYQLSSFVMVQADISMQWNDVAYARSPQLDNGDYSRLFLCGKKTDEDSWKIYEIYWND